MRLRIYIILFLLTGLAGSVSAQSKCCWTVDSMPAVSGLRDSILKWIHRYEDEITAFEAQDDTLEYPKDAVLFVGSSTIRLWKTLKTDMDPIPTINRGFGGSTMVELDYYSERIIYKYSPKAIVVYCGENDLAVSFSRVEDVLNEFKNLNERREVFLPETKVFFISIKPSPSRSFYLPKFEMANALVKEYVDLHPTNLHYIDITSCMYDKYGKIDESIFRKDRLHMNSTGYERWTNIIKPELLNKLNLNVK